MRDVAIPVLSLGLAFALGSIPTGLWWAKARGIDLRRVGSGNLGANNTYRALGARAGLSVLAIDLLKGAIPVIATRAVLGETGGWAVASGVAAVLGHIVSPLAGFRGGKGVATGAGAMLALAPAAALIAIGVFVVTVAITRYVSLGSILAAGALPLAVRATAAHVTGLDWAAAAIAAVIIGRHWGNIGRLLAGTERRFRARESR
jgi:glycerol-3-phosphate acyltransferase PlsY